MARTDLVGPVRFGGTDLHSGRVEWIGRTANCGPDKQQNDKGFLPSRGGAED